MHRRSPGPSAALLALEARAWLEFASLIPALPLLRLRRAATAIRCSCSPAGSPSDRSTQALRWFLRDRGYHAHGWRLGRNHGPSSEIVSGMAERLAAAAPPARPPRVARRLEPRRHLRARALPPRFPTDVRR